MKKRDSETRLKRAILRLENQQAEESAELKEQLRLVAQNIEPLNLLKKTFRAAAASQDLKQDIINTSVGLGAGFISKRFLKDVAKSPLKKLIGVALIFGVTAIIVKKPEIVKSIGSSLLKMMLSKSNIPSFDRNDY